MPDVLITTGDPTMPSGYFRQESELGGLDMLSNLGRGILDDNWVLGGVRRIVENIKNERPDIYEVDDRYDPYHDDQLFKYKEYMGNFLHSKNKEHTTYLINRFKEKAAKIQGDPSYIIGRILGGLTDPTSLFMFTKAGSVLLSGTRLARSLKMGTPLMAEEAMKRYLDQTRPMTESVAITAGGFIIPTMFPSINANKSTKKFDKNADFLDEADNNIFGKNTMGAAQPIDTKIITEAEEQAMNKIQPTGLGVFGENVPTSLLSNPVFIVLQKGITSAQDMIESVLESPLYTIKNFQGIATKPSIERNVKLRYTPLVIETTKKLESLYATYLHKLGKNKQNFFERTFDTKINRGKGVMSPKEFREAVWDARSGRKDLPEEVIKASKELDGFFGKLGKEYDDLGIVPAALEREIDKIDYWIRRTKNKELMAELQAEKKILKDQLDYIKENGSLAKNYITISYKRDRIKNNFTEFKKILTVSLRDKNPRITQKEIDEIADNFLNYQPYIRLNAVSAELDFAVNSGKKIPDGALIEHFKQVNKISSRFKSRELNIDYRALADAGFIEKDVSVLMRYYFNQVVPDIEITKVFGDPLGYGTRWKPEGTSQMGIKQIAEEYDVKIEDLLITRKYQDTTEEVTKINKQVAKLQEDKTEILTNLDASIALIRGTYGLADDPNRSISQGIRMFKLYNALTMLTGLSQVVDTARLVMINGIGKTFRMNFELMSSGMAKDIAKKSMNTTQLGGEATDLWDSSRAMRMYDLGDSYGVYNKFEKGFSGVGNLYFTFINMTNPWNAGVKTIAGFYNGTRMLENIELLVLGKKLTKVNSARLNNLGIDDAMAKEIYKQYKKHGVGKNGKKSWKQNGDSYKIIRVANTEAWDQTPKAKKAADAFHSAIGKQANIDIVTPAKGDVPLWANTEIGGVLTQFKKFGMAATQRMLMRGLQEKDANFMSGVLMLLAAGAMVDAYRGKAYNRDYSKKPFQNKVVDAFDRSGLGGIFSDINNSIERLGNNEIGIRPLLGGGRPYGTYRDLLNNPIPDVLGPTASQLSNIADIMYTWGTGKYNHHTARNVRRLLPFQNVWYMDSLFDDIEKGALRR
tara:strand:+ start:18441 stop:21710 length:3270 start_codon:yes stop_codon:yes gene_type:complete